MHVSFVLFITGLVIAAQLNWIPPLHAIHAITGLILIWAVFNIIDGLWIVAKHTWPTIKQLHLDWQKNNRIRRFKVVDLGYPVFVTNFAIFDKDTRYNLMWYTHFVRRMEKRYIINKSVMQGKTEVGYLGIWARTEADRQMFEDYTHTFRQNYPHYLTAASRLNRV